MLLAACLCLSSCHMPHASSCCTRSLVYFSQLFPSSAPPLLYIFFCVYILFCALLRAILICIFIPWPAERAAQHIFRLYAYYNARDRRTEREGRQRERERGGETETDNRQIRCVGGERGQPKACLLCLNYHTEAFFPTRYLYSNSGYMSFAR